MQSCSMAAQEYGSELQQEFDKGVYSHQPSLTSSLSSARRLMLVNICMKFHECILKFFELQSGHDHIAKSTIFNFKGP